MRMAALGGETALGLVYCNLQVNNQSYCRARDPTNPLKPCEATCSCNQPVIYDAHDMNFQSLLKVSHIFNRKQFYPYRIAPDSSY